MNHDEPAFALLTAEERFLWACARSWRDPRLPHPDKALDWPRLVDIALDNRLPVLLDLCLTAAGLADTLPPAAAAALQRGVDRFTRRVTLLAPALRDYLGHAARLQQDVVVIKGLWLSQKIYGRDAMRPGADIDLLLREADIPVALRILEEEMGYGRWWRPLLDDRYYQRHHLHQQRCNHNRSIWIEPHWRFDHPYTRLTIDYERLMNRATAGDLWGLPVRQLVWPDLLLSLAIHLVKHAVYLPAVYDRPDLPRLILADGLLLYFVDVAEVVKQHAGEIDWQLTVDLAREGGAVAILGSVLHVCRAYLDAPVPGCVLSTLAVPPPGAVTGWLMHQLVDYQIAVYLGQSPGRLWPFLLGFRESVIFRPIRLLDLATYLWPGPDYLRRRYGRASAGPALAHLFRAAGQYLRVAADTLFFTWQRRRQVRRLDKAGFVWPELPPEP